MIFVEGVEFMAKFCPNCGSEVTENSNFCTKCGTNLENNDTSSSTVIINNYNSTNNSNLFHYTIINKKTRNEYNVFVSSLCLIRPFFD